MSEIRTLVLNCNYMPLSVFPLYTINAEEAFNRLYTGSADLVLEYDRRILTPSRDDLFWPSVIANRNGFAYSDEVKLKRETLYYRDHGKCMYCEKPLEHYRKVTYDHVVPVSKGGADDWENIVAACQDCNQSKGDHLPKGKWRPRQMPYRPNYFQLLEQRKNFPIVVADESWMQFLPEWKSDVYIRNNIVCEAA